MAAPEIEEALKEMRRGRITGQIVIHVKDGEARSVETVVRRAVTASQVGVRTFVPTASCVRVINS